MLWGIIFLLISVFYVYGLEKFVRDANFMLNRSLGRYWKFCWGFIVPGTLCFLFVYFIGTFETPTYGEKEYPNSAIVIGILLVLISLAQVPIGTIYSFCTSEQTTIKSKLHDLTTPTMNWAPIDDEMRNLWLEHRKILDPMNEELTPLNNPTATD